MNRLLIRFQHRNPLRQPRLRGDRSRRREPAPNPFEAKSKRLTTRHRQCQKSISQRGSRPGRHQSSVALCGQLRAIDKRRVVGAPMGRLSKPDLEAVERAVRRCFDAVASNAVVGLQ